MVRHLETAKKLYRPPSFQLLDPGAAKAELEAAGSQDVNAQEMLSAINQQLEAKTSTAHPGLRNRLG